jgi:hypothetical protein
LTIAHSHVAWARVLPGRKLRRVLPVTVLVVLVVSAIGFATSTGSSPSAAARLHAVGGYIAGPRPAVSIYVSPAGSDRNPGTRSLPLQTLSRARNLVRRLDRNMRGNIAVYLESGIYRLRGPLRLGPRDSGTNGHKVVWSAVRGQSATISGSVRISGWMLIDSRRGIWAARVPKGLDTRQIYVNGMRATLASGPAPVKLTRTATGYRASSSLMAHWRDPTAIDFVYTAELGLHVEPICPVGAIRGPMITMAEPCWKNSNLRAVNLVGYGRLSLPAYIENAYELLDKQGQFYLDRHARMLYYVARNGEDMGTADVEVPVLQTLVAGRGAGEVPIHNLTFSNLQFSYATWLQPGSRKGFSEVQAGYTLTTTRGYARQGLCQFAAGGTCPYGAWTKEPGNIQFAFDQNISFLNDRFAHLGAAGLNLANGSQGDVVKGCVFTDISGNGIEVGGVNMPRAVGLAQTRAVRIVDNHLYGLAAEYHGGVAILVGYAADTTVSHNQIDHIPYTAISIGWGGWPDKVGFPAVPNFSHGNIVAHNLIFDFMQTLADGGGVYTQGITGSSMKTGEQVTGNVIHDQYAWGRALQSDDGATFITYRRNVLYNDNYDYGDSRFDAALNHGRYDRQIIAGNYWQQGHTVPPQRNQIHDRLVTGPRQAPATIVAHAGISPPYRYILRWQPAGESVPSSPSQVARLYAYGGRAYITWHPAVGTAPAFSYSVAACPVRDPLPQSCHGSANPVVTISAAAFIQRGYAVVPGLKTGSRYTFTVTANGATGSGTPSIPSQIVTIGHRPPSLPGRPSWVGVQPGPGNVRVMWYPPPSIRCDGPWWAAVCRNPVLSYTVTSSRGRSYTVAGLRQLIVWNKRGRALHVIGGLEHGTRYRFSVAAVTPAGVGPAVTSAVITPT